MLLMKLLSFVSGENDYKEANLKCNFSNDPRVTAQNKTMTFMDCLTDCLVRILCAQLDNCAVKHVCICDFLALILRVIKYKT